MKKHFLPLVALLLAVCLPCIASAQSVSDDLNEAIYALSIPDASLSADMAMLMGNTFDLTRGVNPPPAQPGAGRAPSKGRRPSEGHRPAQGHRPVEGHAPAGHGAVYHEHVEVHNVLLEAVAAAPIPEDDRYTIGLGLRIFGDYVSGGPDVGGGVGWNFKLRPVRWISIEFVNDYIINTYGRDDVMVRVPMYLGVQAHVFDYGNLDVYGVVAGGASLLFPEDYYGCSSLWQAGLQAGGGIAFLVSGFEMGLDVRYTFERHIRSGIDQHGVIFSLNIGFAR